MKRFSFSSTRGPLRRAAIAAILATAVACFTVPSLAGPKGTIHVRPLGDRKLTIDGDISDWPLAQFKKVAEQPVFPAGQNADSTTADGDHLVFDKTRIGLFNGTTTDAFQANDSDFGVTTYFAHDLRNLYILAVFIDDTLRDDNDTSQFGSSGFLNDGFEFFLDAKGDKLADGSVAPNKRIGLFLGQIASPNANTDPAFANLTADGKKLILNTVAYALGASTPPLLTLSATRVGSKIHVTWTDIAAKLESASTVNGNYTAVANAASPYDQDISSAQQQFFRLTK